MCDALLGDALAQFEIKGIATNIRLLRAIASHPDFVEGRFDTRWLETILLADRNSRRSQNTYNDEYYDHFYNAAAVILIRQLSDAATDVGSYWLTAWINAGRPQLPH